ncbi:MAG TPA: DNA repair protein RecO [Acidobacteriota bacterium]|jgi:DNA repair protein RecO (recombination protein O)
MTLKTTEAITLRNYPYREADRIVVFFTRSQGKLRGIARGARRLRSHFGSSLEPISHVRLVYFAKENQDLVSINSCDLLESHASLRGTLEGSYYCAYVSEVLSEFTQEGAANEKVFRLMLAVLDPSLTLSWEARARYFETWMLRLEGVFPMLQNCGRCGRSLQPESVFVPSGGHEACCRKCAAAGDLPLSTAELQLVYNIFSHRISDIDWSRWSPAAMKNLGLLNSKLIQYHLEKALKSGRFLKELNRC